MYVFIALKGLSIEGSKSDARGTWFDQHNYLGEIWTQN